MGALIKSHTRKNKKKKKKEATYVEHDVKGCAVELLVHREAMRWRQKRLCREMKKEVKQ